tara:strand:- start:1409 stop:1978 length:570 start_codon:yes stop_codon:yes gene_type:complete
MKNSIQFFLVIAIIFLSSVYFLSTIVSYERQVEDLQEQVDILYLDIEFSNAYCDSISQELDSLQNRYQIFDDAPGKEFIDIINAIMQVESNGNPNAYAPGEDAVGILQIRQCMVDDVNRILKRQKLPVRYTYLDRWDVNKSFEMFDIFCDYYDLNTAETMARGWNGGPRGINKSSTLDYWEKVQGYLDS